MPPPTLQFQARTGHPDFLDLPWELPLEEWTSSRLVRVVRGIGRHVVRFVDYDGVVYALKELPGETRDASTACSGSWTRRRCRWSRSSVSSPAPPRRSTPF